MEKPKLLRSSESMNTIDGLPRDVIENQFEVIQNLSSKAMLAIDNSTMLAGKIQ